MVKEEDIIANCIKGESSAQEALYRKYASKMRMVCLRYASTTFEADDVFQDAFVKIFSNIKNYKGEGSFEGWMKRIFVNTAIDSYKKNLRSNSSYLNADHEDFVEEAADDNFEKLADSLSLTELLEIINKLPEGYKMVFNLYAIESYTHKQIAEVLHISEGTSKSQLSKARKLLQSMVQQQKILIKG